MSQAAGEGTKEKSFAEVAGSETQSSSAGAAPTTGDDSSKPKGKNITEGGFDSDAPNASFNNEVGGKNDPGRAALGEMQEKSTSSSGASGPVQSSVTNDGQYDVLEETSS